MTVDGRRPRRLVPAFATLALLMSACSGGPVASGDTGNVGHGGSPPPPPAKCPLTGLKPASGAVPNRPALAVKVENVPEVRPQTGLSHADIIYEEPVEAGITRFIVVYQCDSASKIEPIRSGRLTDPGVLTQFGHPLFAYAGGVPEVIKAVADAGLVDINFDKAVAAYHRDTSRAAPHNLYSSTSELYAAAHSRAGAPRPVFTYSSSVPSGGKRVSSVHLPFSGYSDVYWKWDAARGVWLRFHGSVPHTYSDGTQVNAKNVVIQLVQVRTTDIHDVNGVVSPEAVTVGSGRALVLRDGKIISGRWTRPGPGDVTKFLDASGAVIPLAPGNTWVELLPNTITPTSAAA